jgi:hydroxylamine reductase
MMCYQCEQTTGGTGCTTIGICKKDPVVAGLQDLQVAYNKRVCQLATRLGAVEPSSPLLAEGGALVVESNFATLTNVNFSEDRFRGYLSDAARIAAGMEDALRSKGEVPSPAADLPSNLASAAASRPGAVSNAARATGLDARKAAVQNDDLFGVVEMATYGWKGVSAYFWHAEQACGGSGAYSEEERAAVHAELFRLGDYLATAGSHPGGDLGTALAETLAVGALNLKVMGLLDQAHTTTLGTPAPTEVPTIPRTGRHAILVSGHDLPTVREILEQTAGKNIDVYTHGEVLPAHAYPELKKHEHLAGHYGTAWQNQTFDFRDFPGAIVMTSNCLRPPTSKYKNRLFTAGPVGFDGLPHVGTDFSSVVECALALPQFSAEHVAQARKRAAHAEKLLTGFGHAAVLGAADIVVAAVKSGDLKNIFVIGGCDGTESARSYFGDLAKAAPQDSLILTLGCGKFRLTDHDHGTLGGLPRLLDMGQCNDAYSAVIVAVKLAEALGCSVHDLPLRFAVSWFEQKAVAVLLTLLHLELKNIRLGPALPAFVTPGVLQVLNEKFQLQHASLDDETVDLKNMLAGK